MRFDLVAERLSALPSELPAPPEILTPIRVDSPDELMRSPAFSQRQGRVRQAAVLALLFPDELAEARVLLTARVPDLPDHAGEISFPGGSAEPGDQDPVATALREAREEVDLDPSACGLRVVGALERFTIPVSGFRVTPVVAVAGTRPECTANPAEVARILTPPVEAFLPDAPVELEERVIRERLVRYGVYPVEGERVWGATARMLGQLGALLAGGAADGGQRRGATAAELTPATPGTSPPVIRRAGRSDAAAIDPFMKLLGPELSHSLPPPRDTLLAELDGAIAGLASWAPWERPRPADQPRGFAGLSLPDEHLAAELTLLAVAPELRHRGIGRELTDAVCEVARSASCSTLLAWTLADSAVHPSAGAARAFFRANGFKDLAVDRRCLARGEERLLMLRALR